MYVNLTLYVSCSCHFHRMCCLTCDINKKLTLNRISLVDNPINTCMLKKALLEAFVRGSLSCIQQHYFLFYFIIYAQHKFFNNYAYID